MRKLTLEVENISNDLLRIIEKKTMHVLDAQGYKAVNKNFISKINNQHLNFPNNKKQSDISLAY